jgi:hypothetical protein
VLALPSGARRAAAGCRGKPHAGAAGGPCCCQLLTPAFLGPAFQVPAEQLLKADAKRMLAG